MLTVRIKQALFLWKKVLEKVRAQKPQKIWQARSQFTGMRWSGEPVQRPPSLSPLRPSQGRTPCTSSTRSNCSATVAPVDRSPRLFPGLDSYPIASALSVDRQWSHLSRVHTERNRTQKSENYFHVEYQLHTHFQAKFASAWFEQKMIWYSFKAMPLSHSLGLNTSSWFPLFRTDKSPWLF